MAIVGPQAGKAPGVWERREGREREKERETKRERVWAGYRMFRIGY